MTRTRIGAVGYLNARPLVEGLADDPYGFDVRFDLPAVCARLLHEGSVDIGLVPVIEYLNGDYVMAPGIGVAADGDVASVALYTRVPIGRVRTLALDTSSRTSAALTRVLCREQFGIDPAFVAHPPDLARMLETCDAGLLIGDPALDADAAAHGAEKIDLGAAWKSHTGLPFVFAAWVGRAEHFTPGVVAALEAAKVRGVAHRDRIADLAAGGDPVRAARYRAYLHRHIQHDLGPRHTDALRRFYLAAENVGVVDKAREPRFAARAGAGVPAL
jgi:chorismate dehydratase